MEAKKGSTRGAINLCFFYAAWLGGSALFPVALGCAYCGIYAPSYFVICYYSFRAVFPAKHWPFLREQLSGDKYTYTRKSEIVCEEGASSPEPNSHTLISVAPHGILTLGWSYCISSDMFSLSKAKWLVAPAMMMLPFVSDIMHWTSCYSADPASMKKIMGPKGGGCNVGLIPGGFQESTLYKRGKHRVYFKKRKGFIKYALKYGYKIQPCYCFGEELSFWTVDLLPRSVAYYLNSFNIPTCCFLGKYFFMPDDDIDFTVVVGTPIPLPERKVSKENEGEEYNPTAEEVDEYHKKFIDAYVALFNKFKGKYAAEGDAAELEIY